MRLEYDPSADAAYVELDDDRTVDWTHELDQNRFVDYAEDDRVLGYEFLNVSRGVDLADLPDRDVLSQLFQAHNIRILV
jgi:uncharacterized protein YuzE